MRIIETIPLIKKGAFATSNEWSCIRSKIHEAVQGAEWPPGKGKFLIYPESGRGSGKGNGVVPIKDKPMELLEQDGWTLEHPWEIIAEEVEDSKDKSRRKRSSPGGIDAAKRFDQGLVVVEWETGNVSSSHRAINKMALGLVTGRCIAGVLVIPNRKFARFLTDRIGNVEEISPYFPLWRRIDTEGVLEIVVIQHDEESTTVPRIPKGKDGRSAEGLANLAAAAKAKLQPQS